MKNKPILTVTYLVLALIVVFSVFVNPNQSNYSESENRTLKTSASLKDLSINSYMNKELQDTVSSLMKDQFPLKDELNKIYIKGQTIRGDIISSLTANYHLFLIPVGTVYRISGTNYYINDLVRKKDELTEVFNNRIWNFEKIYEKYGDKYKMYIYKPVSAEDMTIFGVNDGEEYWKEFVTALGKEYKIKRQETQTLDDYMKLHYATDHHWNYIGAYKGYEEIINMICEDFPDVAKPYKMINVVEHKEPFYGSSSIHNEKRLGYETFTTYDIDYNKNYTIYVNDEQVEQLGTKEKAFENYNKKYFYEDYYGSNEKYTKIINNNCGNDRSILIFGDSFSNSILEDIAAHFKTTYKVDTRFIYDESHTAKTTFSLDNFLKENDVDCILWLQFYSSLYFDPLCYLPIETNE